MYTNEFSNKPFACYYNGKVYKLEWLHSPNLKSDYSVDIGIDQSSSSTGICIQSKDLMFLTELPRDDMSVNEYKRALKKELHVLLKTLSVRHFVFEKHRHITPLENVINEITSVIKSYTKVYDKHEVKIAGIAPPVWRKGFFKESEMADIKYTREFIKDACVNQAIVENPALEKFKAFSHKDFDAYEAYGIINGYMRLNYADDGTRIVNTSMEYREGRKYKYQLFQCNKSNIKNTINYVRSNIADEDTPLVYANEELLLDNSMNRLMGEYDSVILAIFYHSEFPSYVINLGQEYHLGDMYIAYGRRN
jgi:hypothetical protein